MLPIEISFQGGLVSPPDVWPSDLRRGLTRPASGSVGRLRVATTTCHHHRPQSRVVEGHCRCGRAVKQMQRRLRGHGSRRSQASRGG